MSCGCGSPSTAPPLRPEEGSTAMMAILGGGASDLLGRPGPRIFPLAASVRRPKRVDLPEPGAPMMPIACFFDPPGLSAPPVEEFSAPEPKYRTAAGGTALFQDAQETTQRTAAARASLPQQIIRIGSTVPPGAAFHHAASRRAAPDCLTHLLGDFLRGCARRHDRSDARAEKLLGRASIHIAAHDHRSIQASRPQALAYQSYLSQLIRAIRWNGDSIGVFLLNRRDEALRSLSHAQIDDFHASVSESAGEIRQPSLASA